jgi:DNA polymerase V
VVYELRGISWLPLEFLEPTRKGIAVTGSFRNPVASRKEMREAIASHATRAADKLRRYEVAAVHLFVSMSTSAFQDEPF